MRWKDRRQSENVEDRRGMRASTVVGGGIGTILLALLIYALGGNPADVIQQADPQASVDGQQIPGVNDESKEFVSVVLADTEDVWNKLFSENGRQYREPKLVLFSGQVQSACGFANSAVGPFYCPADQQVYLDTSFFNELHKRFGAPGDFAQAYVIAHEVGHHVQQLLGTADRVHAMRNRVSEAEYNQLSVKLELQADFLAGVWAHHAQKMKNILDPDDVEEALRAASAIGDDKLQMESQGYVVPDSFTHGTSEQRVRWFMKGFKTGDMSQGDTFSTNRL
jgi:predicted metalloprotease